MSTTTAPELDLKVEIKKASNYNERLSEYTKASKKKINVCMVQCYDKKQDKLVCYVLENMTKRKILIWGYKNVLEKNF